MVTKREKFVLHMDLNVPMDIDQEQLNDMVYCLKIIRNEYNYRRVNAIYRLITVGPILEENKEYKKNPELFLKEHYDLQPTNERLNAMCERLKIPLDKFTSERKETLKGYIDTAYDKLLSDFWTRSREKRESLSRDHTKPSIKQKKKENKDATDKQSTKKYRFDDFRIIHKKIIIDLFEKSGEIPLWQETYEKMRILYEAMAFSEPDSIDPFATIEDIIPNGEIKICHNEEGFKFISKDSFRKRHARLLEYLTENNSFTISS